MVKIFFWFLLVLLFPSLLFAEGNNGTAPEITSLNAKDISWALEARLPDLEKPYISVAPEDKKDGLIVGKLGIDGGDTNAILQYADELASPARIENPNDPLKGKSTGNIDSLLIWSHGKLLFESYYRRGRANYPHYQMSITKSYTALALGRAIELGYFKMEDLDKPAISFLRQLETNKLTPGAESITLSQAMEMSSGIRLDEGKARELLKTPALLKAQGGQGEIQAYLQNSAPIPPVPREFKYQESDPDLAMQVLNAVVPGGAEAFIRDELLLPLGITNYHWEKSVSDLPKSAAGSSLLSRDMLKIGQLVLNKGKWQGRQLIPEAYITRATSPQVHSYGTNYYGYFWWVEDIRVGEKSYHAIEGRGAGGQFIFIVPELDLIAVVTSHDKGMGDMLTQGAPRILKAFTPIPYPPLNKQ
jgi:CubicO group peptidase (beta-lactamase class C family)